MDPLGFALENFDAVGKWRTTDANEPIDASGVLVDGTAFTGPAELRKALVERQDQFVFNVAQKLLICANLEEKNKADRTPLAVARREEGVGASAVREATRRSCGSWGRPSNALSGSSGREPLYSKLTPRTFPALTKARNAAITIADTVVIQIMPHVNNQGTILPSRIATVPFGINTTPRIRLSTARASIVDRKSVV